MITSRKELFEAILLDRKRYNYSLKSYLKGMVTNLDSYRAVRLLTELRKTEFYYNNRNKGLFHKFLYTFHYIKYSRLQCKYDTYIFLNCCKPGLWIPHVGGVIVNCKSMGYNCSVNKGVVIENKKGQDNRAVIGDNCYFTLGCKVLGKVNIGNNVIVAQNSVVIKDISDNTIVSGIPAKPIKTFYNMDEINI